MNINRRAAATRVGVATTLLMHPPLLKAGTLQEVPFQLNYMLSSCMYGYSPLAEIVTEVARVGAKSLDVWPKVHGSQREQMNAIGLDATQEIFEASDVQLGCITQYSLGPFGLKEEFQVAKRFGCSTIVTGGKGPKGLKGEDLRDAVHAFVREMKPHLKVAQRAGVVVAIENHGNNLIESPDSLKWLAEAAEGLPLKIALAPYHLPQDPKLISQLIYDLGDALGVFYAWQHGEGCMQAMPKEKELLQMPGRGPLDFQPILKALKATQFSGWTSIFMHPFPRGIPILATTKQVTDEINRARKYLEQQLD